MAGKVTNGMVSIDKPILTEEYGFLCRSQRSAICLKVESSKSSNEHLSNTRLFLSSRGFQHIIVKPYSYTIFKRHGVSCHSNGREVKEYMRKSRDCTELSSQLENEHARGTGRHSYDRQVMSGSETTYSNRGIAEACKFAYNDAKFVNERARNDFVLLSRSISKLNNRAREDVAVLGLGFLKLDARAKEDSEIIDHGVKQAAHIHHIVTGKAQSKLKKVADQHWSDGALETDLRRADFCFKRRAMEDAFMALKFVKRIHELMATNMNKQSQKQGSFSVNDMMGFVTLEKNGKALDLLAQEVTTGRISAIQDAYWSMASALSEADGIDYTDPEELELLVATLIDLDAMDGKRSVSLLVECSSSPDVSTRQALANALASAPSIWTLGNAGMGALQRLSEDSNPAVAAAASKAISELKQQWELEEGDSLRFMMNQYSKPDDDDNDDL